MILTNTEARLITLPPVEVYPAGAQPYPFGDRVVMRLPDGTTAEPIKIWPRVSIPPGSVEVPDEYWRRVAPKARKLVEAGWLLVDQLDAAKRVETSLVFPNLLDRSDERALELIAFESDERTLRRWRASERRANVRSAIADRLRDLVEANAGAEPDEAPAGNALREASRAIRREVLRG